MGKCIPNTTAHCHLTTYAYPTSDSIHGFTTAAAGELVLPSGSNNGIMITAQTALVINDIGLTVSIGVHSAQAVYYSETNIQAHP